MQHIMTMRVTPAVDIQGVYKAVVRDETTCLDIVKHFDSQADAIEFCRSKFSEFTMTFPLNLLKSRQVVRKGVWCFNVFLRQKTARTFDVWALAKSSSAGRPPPP